MFTVIYNPAAGKFKAQKALPAVLKALDERKIEYNVLSTSYPPNKAQYADVPCGKEDTVCVVGGDGTVFDVLNSLPERHMRLISVPCGTGNDFIKCVKLPKNPIKALCAQLDGDAKALDYVLAGEECFLNVFGTGFDVEVLKKLEAFKKTHTGLKAYLAALVKAVKEYRPVEIEVSVDGGEFITKQVSILSVGNGRYIGGGMKAVPDANPFDGKLNVVEVRPIKKRQLLFLLPAFIFGLHIKFGLAKTYSCKSISIKSKALSYQMDGEVRARDEVKMSVIPGALEYFRTGAKTRRR